MCLCALFFHTVPDYPLVMAANREEAYGRAAHRPDWLRPGQDIFAGQDLVAGGTWQGLNRDGVLIALTNGSPTSADPSRRSRGLLCLDALQQPTAARALEWLVHHLRSHAYNAFNLICADTDQAFAVHSSDPIQIQALQPGLHLLADTQINDSGHPRVRRARALLADHGPQTWEMWARDLARTMADHAPERPQVEALCRHGRRSGTVSSSLIGLGGRSLDRARFAFAEGPPCTSTFADLTPQIHALHTRPRSDRHLSPPIP